MKAKICNCENSTYLSCGSTDIAFSYSRPDVNCRLYRGADTSLARPGRKQATATEDFDVHISYL
jgi:hypothetical protein